MEVSTKSVQTPITQEFLEKILNQKIVSFQVSQGTKPGDNYSTNLISLEVTVADNPEKKLHLLYKTFPNHPVRQNLMKDYNVFLKEFQVYDLWIRELKIFGDPVGLKLAVPEMMVGSAIDYSSDDAKINKQTDLDPILANFVLMTDARKTDGFKMANKLHGLDYNHVKLVLEELAKYHATGHAYKIKNKLPNFISKFPFMVDSFFCNQEQKGLIVKMFQMNVKMLMDKCKDYLEMKPEVAESLNKFAKDDSELGADYLMKFLDPEGMDEEEVEGFMRKLPNNYKNIPPLKEQWIVASHGDCWTNNILFKYDSNGKVMDTLLVDLQVVRECCIMTDLVYFLYTSTDAKVRKHHLQEILKQYYDKFVYFCEILEVDPFPGFTFENFLRKFQRSKIIGLLFGLMVLPVILQKSETSVDLDSVEMSGEGNGGNETEEFINAMYQKMGKDKEDEKILRHRLTEILEELYEDGVL